MKTVRDVGEWGLLKKVLPSLNRFLSKRVQVKPGDDAAVLKGGFRGDWVFTTDMLVEGVHFDRKWTSGQDLGYKAMAVNLSDLAAMGNVRPIFGLISLGITSHTPVDFVDKFQKGLQSTAKKYGVDLVGGDTVKADQVVVSVALGGQFLKGARPICRSGARVGDFLMVSGTLGDAAAGLAILQGRGPQNVLGGVRDVLTKRLLRPTPRLDLIPKILKRGSLNSLMDCSDGLWRSTLLLSESSRVGIEIDVDRLPISKVLSRWAFLAKKKPSDLALVGGEDYELVMTAPPGLAKNLERHRLAVPIGRVVSSKKGVRAFENGKIRRIPLEFKHFKR